MDAFREGFTEKAPMPPDSARFLIELFVELCISRASPPREEVKYEAPLQLYMQPEEVTQELLVLSSSVWMSYACNK